MNNLFEVHIEIAEDLIQQYDHWAKQVGVDIVRK